MGRRGCTSGNERADSRVRRMQEKWSKGDNQEDIRKTLEANGRRTNNRAENLICGLIRTGSVFRSFVCFGENENKTKKTGYK